MRFRTAIFFCALLLSAGCTSHQVSAPTPNPACVNVANVRQLACTSPATGLHYWLYEPTPDGQANQSKRPLLLFLHGFNLSGSYLNDVLAMGVPAEIENGRQLPMVVVSPQCPYSDNWPASEMVARLSRLVTELIGSYNLDPGRVYVTGFSMGGDGTWALGIAHPEQFAALLPVSRWYRKYDLVCALKALPVHVYQSELDEVVPAPIAKKMTADLEVCGGNVQLTLFPEGRHNETCGIAYARDEIYQWLDAQKKE